MTYFDITSLKAIVDVSEITEEGIVEVGESGEAQINITQRFANFTDLEVTSLTPSTTAYPAYDDNNQTIAMVTLQNFKGQPASGRVRYKLKGF